MLHAARACAAPLQKRWLNLGAAVTATPPARHERLSVPCRSNGHVTVE